MGLCLCISAPTTKGRHWDWRISFLLTLPPKSWGLIYTRQRKRLEKTLKVPQRVFLDLQQEIL